MQIQVIVLSGRLTQWNYAQAARHAQVDDQSTCIQLQQHVFCHALDLANGLTLEAARQVHWPTQAGLTHCPIGQLVTNDVCAYAAHRGFDLRKFRHRLLRAPAVKLLN